VAKYEKYVVMFIINNNNLCSFNGTKFLIIRFLWQE